MGFMKSGATHDQVSKPKGISMMRLILSILAGWIIGAVLSVGTDHVLHITRVFPPYGEPMHNDGLLALAFAYRSVFSILACYLAAMWAKDNAKKAVWSLGIIGTILWLGGSIAMWEFAHPWYNIAGIVTAIPLALIGGRLYAEYPARTTSATNDITSS
jgi:hypothetical protein